jgi:hypothetical protein
MFLRYNIMGSPTFFLLYLESSNCPRCFSTNILEALFVSAHPTYCPPYHRLPYFTILAILGDLHTSWYPYSFYAITYNEELHDLYRSFSTFSYMIRNTRSLCRKHYSLITIIYNLLCLPYISSLHTKGMTHSRIII